MGLFNKLKKTFGFTSDDDSKVKQTEGKEQSAVTKDEDGQLEKDEESSKENIEDSSIHSTENNEPDLDDNVEDLKEDHQQINSEKENKSSLVTENQNNKIVNDELAETSSILTNEKSDEEQSNEIKSNNDDDWEMTTRNDHSNLEDQSQLSDQPTNGSESSMVESSVADVSDEEIQSQDDRSETGRYTHGLTKTRSGFKGRINALLANFRHVDEDFFDDLEEMLIESDVGFEAAMKISNELRDEVKFQNAKSKADVSEVIVEKLVNLYEDAGKGQDERLHFASEGPTVFLFVGVNGVGKTTTIGKLAKRYKDQGKKVMVAAGDTFRAGAIQQLDEWAKRVGVTIVKKNAKSDPASVVYDAVVKAKKENYDILLVDTAGRLQNKVNLMNELEKIQRVITREIPDAPHEVLLALDATTGQNALSQAKQFKDATNVTGIILTKLDGTARGGIVLAIRNELHIPVKLVGLGEQVDDLRDFNAEDFAYGLFKGLILSNQN